LGGGQKNEYLYLDDFYKPWGGGPDFLLPGTAVSLLDEILTQNMQVVHNYWYDHRYIQEIWANAHETRESL